MRTHMHAHANMQTAVTRLGNTISIHQVVVMLAWLPCVSAQAALSQRPGCFESAAGGFEAGPRLL